MPEKPLSPDTPLDVERIWLARIRELGPLVQLRRMAELTHIGWKGARQALRRLHQQRLRHGRPSFRSSPRSRGGG